MSYRKIFKMIEIIEGTMGVNSESGIGVDIEDIKRFRNSDVANNKQFLDKIFTKKELDYCFSKAKPEQHLAARYAGKEAVVKALCSLGKISIDYKDIEITNNKNKIPMVKINNKNLGNLKIKISLSHCEDKAIAFVVVE